MEQVYLTALTNERYIPGVMALARSLEKVGAKHRLAIMIPEDKQKTLGAAIYEYGIVHVPNVFLLPKANIFENADDLSIIDEKYSYWRDTFFKLQAAGCVEFEKIVLLDCDQMVVKNIDHLFEALPFTSTTCGRCVHEDWLSLSSNLLVLEPSFELHQKLISLIDPVIQSKKKKGLQTGDQDVFNSVYPTWRFHPELYLHEKYSICWGWITDLCRKERVKPTDFYMIHFPGKEKPWDYGRWYFGRLFFSLLLRGKWNNLFYKVHIWKQYRDLCEPK